MYSRGICKGLRRVASTTVSAVPMVSCTTGVAMGEPGAIERAWNPNPNLPETRLLGALPWWLGDPSALRMPEAVERGRFWETLASPETHGDRTRTVRTYDKSFHFRETSQRWTKTWQRPNPVRCRDCDLRFSFPRSSRNLPFLSHDARVELGQSVMPN